MNLDELLKEQHQIQDDGFTDQVMLKLPSYQNEKRRSLILISSTLIGSLLAYLFLSEANVTRSIFKDVFNGLVHYQTSGLTMVAGVLLIYGAIFFTTSQDLS